jgi:hypothetical protein
MISKQGPLVGSGKAGGAYRVSDGAELSTFQPRPYIREILLIAWME